VIALMLLVLHASPLPAPRSLDEALEQESARAAAATDEHFADYERAMLERFRREVEPLFPRRR